MNEYHLESITEFGLQERSKVKIKRLLVFMWRLRKQKSVKDTFLDLFLLLSFVGSHPVRFVDTYFRLTVTVQKREN